MCLCRELHDPSPLPENPGETGRLCRMGTVLLVSTTTATVPAGAVLRLLLP